MLSRKVKYAIKALITLASKENREPMLISQIAGSHQIPKKFLEAILLELKNNTLLSSKKGKGGGYYLRQNPEEITLARVVRIIDGPIAPTSCVSLNYYETCEDCIDEKTCQLKMIMIRLRDANLEVLEGTSIADILNQNTEVPFMID